MSVLPPEVAALVDRFARNRDAYHSPAYKEAHIRQEFIDPLFKSLGWDVDNVGGLAEAYKDVIHEDAIKVGGATKAPDYCFRIGGTRKFFVEAKKPAVGLETDPEPAYQLRRYAWTSKLPLSILTDFEEFAVYDCRIPPKVGDKASVARVFYGTCDRSADHWDYIAGLFSKDAVLKGAFDKYAESTKRKKGTAEVDTEFLRQIEAWRLALAQNLALRNPQLSVRDLNFGVQRTIDRIIFLRMCEDRGVEIHGGLQALLNGEQVYERLAVLFRRADEKYNSGLFYFTAEADREPPDTFTLGLTLDDRVLKDIIKSLYYPESPYEFSVLPPEVLGQVYEQFLGKVIRLTAGHHAKVEEKPEVRKAGGVYYTPAYIVDYLVKNTVGKLLEGKTPAEIGPDIPSRARGPNRDRKGAARRTARVSTPPLPHGRGSDRAAHPLRILDPACGSGSFLLGAYQYLLNWHRDCYVSGLGVRGSGLGLSAGASSPSPESRVPGPDFPARLYQGPGGQWLLTIQEKKRILLNHIYGVDIDPQAVETTKLALLLKVLEGETEQTIGSTLRLFHERALPDLDQNIKCGNSLIGPDFYDSQQMTMFDEDERLRINAFDWHAEFPEVFGTRDSGPGTRTPSPGPRAPDPASGFDAVIGNPPYLSFSGRQAVEISHAERDYFARHYRTSRWPTSHGLFIEVGATRLSRRFLAFIVPDQVGHLAGYAAVRQAVLGRHGLREVRYWGDEVFAGVVTPALTFVADTAHAESTTIHHPNGKGLTASWREGEPWVAGHAQALLTKVRLKATSLGNLVADPGVHTGNCSEKLIVPLNNRTGGFVPVLEGKQVSRYRCDPPRKALRLDYQPKEGEYFTLRPKAKHTAAQFVVRQTAAFPIVGPRGPADYFRNSLLALYSPADGLDVRYLVGVLNSRLIRYVYTQTVQEAHQKAFPQVKVRSLRDLPIRALDLSLPEDQAVHDRLVEAVSLVLTRQRQLAAGKTPHEKTAGVREVEMLDRQIDQLVYQLYGLTDEEIRTVEDATRPALPRRRRAEDSHNAEISSWGAGHPAVARSR